ncbi:MAG: efflux transporter outer membrane subunit [Methylovulum sp.]|nr:efflux transporter outer membrane subunit [Methylovulum sp.]
MSCTVRRSVYGLLVLTLTSCNTLPERDASNTGIRTPDHWQSESPSGQAAAEHWVAAFADPLLTALVHAALDNNYDLQAAAARINAARESAVIAGAGRLPQLSFVPGYQRVQGQDSGFATTQYEAFDVFFNLSWEIDLWGRIRAAQQAAEQEAAAVAADFYGARLSLAARTAQSYFELTEANLQVQVSEQSVKDRRAIVELVRGRFSLGLTRGLDLRLVLTDLANAEARLADSRNQVQLIARRLEVLLGRYPEGKLTKTTQLPEPPSLLAAGLPSQLLTRRPDLIAAFGRLRAADSRLVSAQRALLPRITLTANGGMASSALADIVDPRAAAWNLAMGLTQPIFAGGRLQGDIRLHKALTAEALNNYRGTALNAFREVEQALAAEQWLRIQEQALKEAVAQTEESRKLAVYSYRQGLIEILTLLDSYRSTLEAQSAHLAVRRQLLNNRINLYLALGGHADAAE